MRKAALGLSLVAAIHLAFAARNPLYADVIPSRPAKSDRQSRAKVAGELRRRGISAIDTAAHVRALSGSDLRYFAGDARRVQLASGLTWEEWVIGGTMVTLLGGVVAFLIIHITED